MAFDTHAAVKTLTDAGADEALAVAVVEIAREASTEATGELVTKGHFDTALAQLESRLAWRLALPCTHYSFWTIPARSLWAMR